MTKKTLNLIGLIIVCILLGTGLYVQLIDHIQPCALCTLQRYCFLILGLTFLIGIFIQRLKIFAMLNQFMAVIFSLAGLLLAGRQVWLQFFAPANQEACGVSLQYMMQALPLQEVLSKILQGSAECAERGWEFLWLNMAEWSLIWFIVLLLLSSYTLIKRR